MKIDFDSVTRTVSLSEIDLGLCFSRLACGDDLYMRVCREYEACDPNERDKETKIMAVNLTNGHLLEIDKNEVVIPKPNATITFS